MTHPAEADSQETPPRASDTPPLRSALVVRFGRMGDVLVLTPVLRALRQALPGARINVLTTPAGRSVLRGSTRVDQVHVLTWRRVPAFINPERARLLRELRTAQYDAVFLLETGQHYHTLVQALGVERVYSFARDGERPGPLRARRADRHELQNQLAVVALAGVAPAGPHYEFAVSRGAHDRALALLSKHGVREGRPLAGIHAGHFQRRRLRQAPHAKSWPADRWTALARSLHDTLGFTVLLTGSQGEAALNRRIMAELPDGIAIDLAGATDLETLGAILQRCDVFIAPDTGPAHLAAAVDTPLVALFGPKPPHIMGPLGDEARIARLHPPASAVPVAQRHGHHARMWAIGVDDVMAAVRQVLSAP